MRDPLSILRDERLALIDELQDLTPAQWSTPSLCGGWTVQDVAAHLAWAPPLSAGAGAAAMLRARLRLNTMIASSAVRWSRRGPDAILQQLPALAAQHPDRPQRACARARRAPERGRPLLVARPGP